MATDRRGHGCFAIDAEGKVRSFTASIRDALIARGVLYRDAGDVWRLTWTGFDLEREQAAWMACCDFCSSRPVTFELECPTFAMPGARVGDRTTAPAVSEGNWMACEACGEDVIAGRRAELLGRSLPTLAVANPRDEFFLPDPETRRRYLRAAAALRRDLHARFWRHYTGRVTRVAPHPFGH
jgi:hypothetical protein